MGKQVGFYLNLDRCIQCHACIWNRICPEEAIQEVEISRFEIMEPSLNEIFIETVTKKEREEHNE